MDHYERELISIIIPVYNVKQYIERCLESIIDQSYQLIEILLIDDGSNDGSEKICDEYAKKYSNIKVLHKKNGGLAEARNVGLDHARGNYIIFLDSDDYVSMYYVENLYMSLKKSNSNIGISMFENVVDGQKITQGKKFNPNDIKVVNSKKALKLMLQQKGIETSAPGKIYKREIIGQKRFPVGKLYEDIMFVSTLLSEASRISIIPNVDYYYYQRAGSIQYQSFNLKKLDCINESKKLNDYIKRKYPDLQLDADSRYFAALCNIFLQIPENKFENERRNLWSEILRLRKCVILNSESRTKNKIAALISYFGPNVMKRIYTLTQVRGKQR